VFLQLFEQFIGQCRHSLLIFMFKILRAAWAIASRSFYKKSPQKKVRWRKYVLVIAVAKVHTPHCDHRRYPVVVAVWATAQSHFKLTVSYILSQQNNELGKRIRIIFGNNYIFKEQWAHNDFSRKMAKSEDFMQCIFYCFDC
jgi:hypothetical protein